MKFAKQFEKKGGQKETLRILEECLSGSELNSYFLHLFQRRTERLSAVDLMRQFENNRFVKAAETNTLGLKALELEWLTYADKQAFSLLTLSPLAPLGSCSVVGDVHQNNVVSATRGTEVVSDATNVLALQIAKEQKEESDHNSLIKYATIHRHVRGQAFNNPTLCAHFDLFCMASGGYDTGSFAFELAQLYDHLSFHYTMLAQKFGKENLSLKFFIKDDSHPFQAFLHKWIQKLQYTPEIIYESGDKDYYKLIQFKIFMKKQKIEIDLADGGLVDWTQKLLSNKKHRLFISACGLELVCKLISNEIY